jgi:hypothetical protein
MVTKPTNAYECIKYIIHIIFLPHVLATLLAILWEGNYKGWIYLDIIKVCETTHRCKALSFKIRKKTVDTDTNLCD